MGGTCVCCTSSRGTPAVYPCGTPRAPVLRHRGPGIARCCAPLLPAGTGGEEAEVEYIVEEEGVFPDPQVVVIMAILNQVCTIHPIRQTSHCNIECTVLPEVPGVKFTPGGSGFTL